MTYLCVSVPPLHRSGLRHTDRLRTRPGRCLSCEYGLKSFSQALMGEEVAAERYPAQDVQPAFLTRIWRHSAFLFIINILVLIWMGFNKTERIQDALCGLRQTGGIRRLRRRRDHLGGRCPVTARAGFVKLTDRKLFPASLHEAKPLKLRRAAIDSLPRFRRGYG